jgi:hypothetical protein
MRLFLDIIVAVLLIAVAWEKSFKERASELPWLRQFIVSEKQTTIKPAPTASPSGAWMRDPNRRSALDTPAPQAPTSTPSSWLFDPSHRSPLDPPPKKHPQSTPH